MKHNQARHNACSFLFGMFFLLCIFCGVFAMSKNALADDKDANNDSFAITGLGDHQYGTNGIGVWPSTGQIRLGLSNTLSDILGKKFDGVGLLNAQLSSDDVNRAKELHDRLCRAAVEKPPTDIQVNPMMTYSISCVRDGKSTDYQGRVGELPKSVAFLADDFFKASIKKYSPAGHAIVKFDVAVSDVQRKKDKFLVEVTFSNSGRFPIRMRTPDQWVKLGGDRLDISGFRTDGNGEWRADLAGLPVLNKGDYPVETIAQPTGESGTFITISSGGSVTYKFLALPTHKVPEGTYEFGALIFANIAVKGVFGVGGRVNFLSDRTRPARAIFNTGYPSTPEEWRDYEARQREIMSSEPVYSGAIIAEAGYYRKISSSGERSQFVTDLRKGASAPGLEHPFDHWEWEADLAHSTRCMAGEPCPREGLWVARTMTMGSSGGDITHPEFRRRLLAGQMTPELSALGGIVPYHYWEWHGV
ncbi:UNVERIFIED_ORG: hypothetical protein ABIC54_005002 [Burkholderia sp. 1263]